MTSHLSRQMYPKVKKKRLKIHC